MALPVNSTQALRTPSELRALVEAIRDAPGHEPETESLEWKSGWDLSEAGKCFETARHILGFGNRNVEVARRHFGGCAYLLAGVEPGNLCGTSPLDPAILGDKLRPYIESGAPRWSPQYVEVDGVTVLVITVESPTEGDSICTLQKGFAGFSAGRIFIRRHGQTEEALPAEVRELERRIRSGRPRVELGVSRADDGPLRTISIPWELKDDWIEAEKERLALPEAPKTPSNPYGVIRPPLFDLSRDPRTRDEYRQEVAAYLLHAERLMEAEVIGVAVDEEVAALKLQIENQTEKNFDGVQVELEIPAGPTVWSDASEVRSELDVPKSPKPWGEKRRIEAGEFDLSHLGFRDGVEINRSEGGTTVRFASEHIRPLTAVALPVLHLILWDDPGEVQIRWRLTSSGVDGQATGTISCQVSDKPMELAMTKPEET